MYKRQYIDVPTITVDNGTGADATGGADGALTAVMSNAENSYIRLMTEEIIPEGTDISYTYQFDGGSETSIVPNQVIDIKRTGTDEKFVGVNDGTGKKVTVKATLTTTDTSISPQLDSQRLSLLSIKNIIETEATAGHTALIADSTTDVPGVAANDSRIGDGFKYLTTTGLAAQTMNYITRTVDLNAPADKLSVFLSANRPNANTNIRVLIKLKTADELYEDTAWYEIKPTEPIPVSGDNPDICLLYTSTLPTKA